MIGGDGSETGLVMKKKKGNKIQQPIYRCQPHPRLQG